MCDVTIISVFYAPAPSRVQQVTRQALDAFDACGMAGEVLLVDNSPSASTDVARMGCEFARVRTIWNDGYNLYLAGALNRAIDEAQGEHVVYLCASHGTAIDPTWIEDLLRPLQHHAIALSGHVQPCQFDRVARVPADVIEPQIHVQGGVWAARTDLLREIRFDHRFPFEFCDVDLSRRCLSAGYELADVPTVRSLAAGTLPHTDGVKFIHDYREAS